MPETLSVTAGDGKLDLGWHQPNADTVTDTDEEKTPVSCAIPPDRDERPRFRQLRRFTLRSISPMDARISTNAGAVPKIMAAVLA